MTAVQADIRRRVLVTGLAVVSPLGCTVDGFWTRLVGGDVGTRSVTRFDAGSYRTSFGGEVSDFDVDSYDFAPSLRGAPRSVQYATAVTQAALRDARLPAAGDAGICMGTVMGTRPHVERLIDAGLDPTVDTSWMSSACLAEVPARQLGLSGSTHVVATGCSAGNDAIGFAYDMVATGACDRMVAGGAEELSEAVFALFTSLRALAPDVARPFDVHRAGILPAEGAAALVLESAESVAARGGRPYAEILGYGCAADAHHLTAPDPSGRGLADAVRAALSEAGRTPSDVGYVNAHGTGTPASDGLEARALATVFEKSTTPVSSIKGAVGHLQGAASALEAVACVLSLRSATIPGMPTLSAPDPECEVVDLVTVSRPSNATAAMNVAFGFGGSASALLVGTA
ncbi:beta-ketoacyl-[acyl-carrier-protein] synthase family protein [Mycolicibacterium farcinogenes]|uniref:beta-ketoacyl-[acyl-carrier-protein] synthase family protein n=1 Tax=Mycolicibacterium farcinogenes TaxID=1802 RepID=UPI001C8CF545|nr:beta-ketoacyl-[acyl-carrier-protein] synthase family protein [Mycolicibacterium farcinogenes]QZH59718.1 beta-ketoacyl-[acyl-carrier-protein] synthase family protein [Mycolicibacterium farcinogenes]